MLTIQWIFFIHLSFLYEVMDTTMEVNVDDSVDFLDMVVHEMEIGIIYNNKINK